MPGQSTDQTDSPVRALQLTTDFYAWERRGRGWDLWPYRVPIEPVFRPFERRSSWAPTIRDDARKPTLVGGWLERLFGRTYDDTGQREDSIEPEPEESNAFEVLELEISLPAETKISPALAEQLLLSLSSCKSSVGYEIVGTSHSVSVQLACARADASHVREQVWAQVPEAVVAERPHRLQQLWAKDPGKQVVVDFGLAQEFIRPLQSFARFDADPLTGIVGALGDVLDGEVALVQILFQTTRAPWSESVTRSVTDWLGDPFFIDAPELASLAKEKTSRPLFAAVVRVAAKTSSPDRSWELAKRLGGALLQFASPTNELIPLSNEDYPDDVHVENLLSRQSHRSGMILNSEELASLVHLPSASIRATRLSREQRRTRAVPKDVLGEGIRLGLNIHAGISRTVTIPDAVRMRHMHLVGASGTGKSTLLLNLFVQDMERGRGVALIDPHGDLVDQLLERVPHTRTDDVILIDPGDSDYTVGVNILSAHSELERTLLASDLVAVFRRLSTSWGDQMTAILANAVLAFLESTKGGTLADLRRFLVEPEFRKGVLPTVRDPEIVYFWEKEFPLLSGRPQGPLLTRLDSFLRPRPIRNMVSQPSSLDFSSILNDGKILLVRLSQGAIGEENAALLGSMFVSKLHQVALARQSIPENERRPFFLYLDEFQNFVTPSLATMLTGARKYKLGLVLAHQELRQLWNQDRDVAGAVLANCGTRIAFRVGDEDSKQLEDGFANFTASDLRNLGVGQAVCRIDRSGWDFSLTTDAPPAPPRDGERRRLTVVESSRAKYSALVKREPSAPESTALHEEDPESIDVGPPTIGRSRTTRTSTPETSAPAVAAGTSLPGRGGAQHKYLQELIRRWAEANGWKAEIEKSILDGLGSVDVALTQSNYSVACEISITSTPSYEIENAQKCLAAGFAAVVIVAVAPRSIEKIRSAISTDICGPTWERVRVLSPEELFAFLGQVSPNDPVTESTSRGYKVKVKPARVGSASIGQTVAKTVTRALLRIRRQRSDGSTGD